MARKSLTLCHLAASLYVANALTTNIESETEIQAYEQSLLQLDSLQQVINQALSHSLQQVGQNHQISVESLEQETENTLISEDKLNDEIRQFLLDSSLLQTNADLKESLLSFKCVVGQKGCIYSDKKSLAQGKMSPNAKQQITKKLAKKPVVAAKTAAAKPKGPPVTAAQSLAQKKAAVAKVTKLAADSKKIAKLAAKPKPKTTKVIAKPSPAAAKTAVKPAQVKAKPVAALAQKKATVATKAKKLTTMSKSVTPKPAITKPLVKKPQSVPKAKSVPKKLVDKTHVQQSVETDLQVDAQGNPIVRQKNKLMSQIKNPMDQMETNIKNQQKKITPKVNVANTNLKNSAKKNFDAIYDSMNHGTKLVVNSNLQDEKDKLGKTELGSMQVKGSTEDVRKEKSKMGTMNSLQVEESSGMEVISEEKEKQRKENQELLKQIDLDSMFKEAKPAAPSNEAVAVEQAEAAPAQTQEQEEPIEAEAKPKPAVQTKPSAKSTPKKINLKMVKAEELVQASNAAEKKTEPQKAIKPQTKKVEKQTIAEKSQKSKIEKCPSCPTCNTQESPLVRLAQQGNDFTFTATDDNAQNPEELHFTVLPKDIRDSVNKEIQVLNSERIIGYNSIEGSATAEDKMNAALEESEYFNVTVNFIVKRKSMYSVSQQEPKPAQVAEAPVQEEQSEDTSLPAVTEDEPKVIMPNELNIPSKSKKFDIPTILKSARISKDDTTNKVAAKTAETKTQEVEQAINNAEQSYDQNQVQAPAELTENQGDASNSFDAAATLEELPPPKEVEVQTEGISTDQAIQLAESSQSQLENQQTIQISGKMSMEPESEQEEAQLMDSQDIEQHEVESSLDQDQPADDLNQLQQVDQIFGAEQEEEQSSQAIDADHYEEAEQVSEVDNQSSEESKIQADVEGGELHHSQKKMIDADALDREETPLQSMPQVMVQKKAMPKIVKNSETTKIQKMAQELKEEEVLEEEEHQLMRDIELDLKMLSRLMKERNPNEGDIEFKIVRVDKSKQGQTIVQKQHSHRHEQKHKENKQNLEKHHKSAKEETAHITETKEVAKARIDEEQKKRQELLEQADKLAKADLEAKKKIREATELAAKAQRKSVEKYRKQLELESKEWEQKLKKLEQEKAAAKKAKKEAEQARKAELAEKARIKHEAEQRKKLEEEERKKAENELKKAVEVKDSKKAKDAMKEQQKILKEKKKAKKEKEKQNANQKHDALVQKFREESEHHKHHSTKKNEDDVQIDQMEQELLEAQERAKAYEQESLEQKAIDQVKEAERKGEEKGKIAAKALIEKQSTQTAEQNQKEVEQLEKKLVSTSEQVQEIITNFHKVHEDLKALKEEYMQAGQDNMNVQLTSDIVEKQAEVQSIVDTLNKIKPQLPQEDQVLISAETLIANEDLIQIGQSNTSISSVKDLVKASIK